MSYKRDLNLINDLNVITSYTTSLFDIIYENCSCDKMEYPNWITLFSKANNDQKCKGCIRNAIVELDLTFDDLRALQRLRRWRNTLAHPRVPLSVAKLIVYSRWRLFPEFVSLKKMLDIISKHQKSNNDPPSGESD